MTSIVLIDDHKLFRKSLADWLATQNFRVLFEANNGKEFIEKLNTENLPQVVLMDINMPMMNGFETTAWIQQNQPSIKVLAISMYDTEMNIIKMLKCGAKGYLLKDSEPQEVALAINTIADKGFYYSDLVNDKLINAINETGYKQKRINNLLEITSREIELLHLICTELTYKEIADKMCVSPKTVEGYREALFEKLNIHSRVGLVMYAIKNGIVNP
ncbi:MAG: response regulator [Chitinophagaceae bacterium]